MIKIGVNSQDFIIIDTDRAITLNLTRAEAKTLARLLLIEFNVTKFYLKDGRAGHEIDEEFKILLKERGLIDI